MSAEAVDRRPVFRRFRSTAKPLAQDAVERQSKITAAAFSALGLDGARVFLNSHHDQLGGRPIDLAVGSVVGAEAASRALVELVGVRTPGDAVRC